MNQTIDYGADAVVPAEDKVDKLAELAQLQAECAATVARLEAELAQAQKEFKDVAEKALPELMDEIGLETFKTKTGVSIEIDEQLHASITAANAEKAHKWLEDNGHGAIIKREVKVSFTSKQADEAQEFIDELAKREKPLEFGVKKAVHGGTLKSFVKSELAEGHDIPQDLLGVFRRRVAKVSATDSKK